MVKITTHGKESKQAFRPSFAFQLTFFLYISINEMLFLTEKGF